MDSPSQGLKAQEMSDGADAEVQEQHGAAQQPATPQGSHLGHLRPPSSRSISLPTP